jgi:hypothetical protein
MLHPEVLYWLGTTVLARNSTMANLVIVNHPSPKDVIFSKGMGNARAERLSSNVWQQRIPPTNLLIPDHIALQ